MYYDRGVGDISLRGLANRVHVFQASAYMTEKQNRVIKHSRVTKTADVPALATRNQYLSLDKMFVVKGEN